MIIKVKQKHIRKGVKSNPESCPVALAVREATNKSINADARGFYKLKPSYIELCKAPRSVKRFIDKFDATGKGKPFNFKLKYESAKN